MTAAAVLTMGTRPPVLDSAPITGIDLYDLPSLDLSTMSGVLIGTGCDQVFLHSQQPLLDAFVHAGGRVVICGHVARPFLSGLSTMAPLDHHGPADLKVVRLADHPVWHGVDTHDLTFRNGVAGFYGRAYYPTLPPSATVIHGIGPAALPLDFVYPFGRGEVIVHGGNDLWGYAADATTAARMTPQLLDWLSLDSTHVPAAAGTA